MRLIPSDSRNLQPLFDETPPSSFSITHAFISNLKISDAKKKNRNQKRRYTV